MRQRVGAGRRAGDPAPHVVNARPRPTASTVAPRSRIDQDDEASTTPVQHVRLREDLRKPPGDLAQLAAGAAARRVPRRLLQPRLGDPHREARAAGTEGTATGGSRPSCSPAISALDPCSTGRAVAGVALRRRTRVQGSRGRSRRNKRSSLGLSRECTGEDVDRQSRRRRRGGHADKQSQAPGDAAACRQVLDAAHVRGVHTGAENRAGVERQKAAQVVE